MARIKKIWKVLGLIVLILFMIGVIGYTTVNYIANKELKKEYQKIRDAGEPLTLRELYSTRIPDKENAALIYQKVFVLIDKNKEEINRITSYIPSSKRIGDWSDEDEKVVSQLIQKNKAIFVLLEEAIQKPKCRFPIEYDKDTEGLLYCLTNMRQCARLLSIKASLEAKNGDINEAVNTCITGLRLGESLSQDSLIISQMVMIAIETIMTYEIEDILTGIEIDATTYDDLYMGLKRAREETINLVGERCFGISRFDYILQYESEPILFDKEKKKTEGCHWSLYYTRLGNPWFKMSGAHYLKTMAKAISISNKPYWQIVNVLDEYEKGIPKYYPTKMMFPAIEAYFEREAYHDALIGAGEIAIELRLYKSRHGIYPGTLKELALNTTRELPLDPFTGQSYIYRKEKEGFIVYSVGANLKDDGGEDERHGGLYEIDIVWRCEI